MKRKFVAIISILCLLVVGTIIFTKKGGTQNIPPKTQPTPTQYPETIQTKYIRQQEWPPKITTSADTFTCTKGKLKKIDGTEYCVESVSQGAAGTVYSDYSYSFVKDNKLIKLQFVIAYPQCDNYDEPQKSECNNERRNFNPDALIQNYVRMNL